MKTKEDFIKAQLNTDKLTPLQWDGILRAMDNYAEQQVNSLPQAAGWIPVTEGLNNVPINVGRIPNNAHSLEVFSIKDSKYSPTGKQAFIGFKIPNGNFHFVGVPYTEPLPQAGETLLNYGSEQLIGSVQQRFKELEHKNWNWSSFYNGWLEGRINMLKEIKG
jgi:hypothetical protein